MEGKRFGKLTVVERAGSTKRYNKIWKCQCDCGNINFVITNSLTRGNTRSCGCLTYKERPYKFDENYINNVKERFKKHFIIENDCWIWSKTKNNFGYGVVSFKGKKEKAHRISYEIFKEPIPKGMYVLHRCDEPRCVNPDHLWLGTQGDNMRDMHKKKRHSPWKK